MSTVLELTTIVHIVNSAVVYFFIHYFESTKQEDKFGLFLWFLENRVFIFKRFNTTFDILFVEFKKILNVKTMLNKS